VCTTILKYKKANNANPNFVIVNNISCTDQNPPVIDNSLFPNKDTFHEDIYSLLKKAFNKIFVLSNNIVLKDAWLKYCHNTHHNLREFDSFHPHANDLVRIRNRKRRINFIDRPLVGYFVGSREGNVYNELVYALGSASVISNNNLKLSKVKKIITTREVMFIIKCAYGKNLKI